MCAVDEQNISKQQAYIPLPHLIVNVGVGGIVVSIAAFQAVDPGSIPGRRNNFALRLANPFKI